MIIEWQSLTNIGEKAYRCGYCGLLVGPNLGYYSSNQVHFIFICPTCNRPTYFDGSKNEFNPSHLYGEMVDHIPNKDVNDLYEEARRCMAQKCFTAAVLCCRKLLMNVSVSLNASPNQKFVDYVNYLEENHYIVPSSKIWVDEIRNKGNDATHEIPMVNENDAQKIIKFSEMLLKTVYEYPALAEE